MAESSRDPKEESSQPIKGTCKRMCPLREVKWRKATGKVNPLELEIGEERPDEDMMITKFVISAYRSSSTMPSEVRTPDTLLLTAHYLLTEVAVRTDYPWHQIYDFICDRLRGVRQELIMQDVQDENKILILEYCTAFHVYASYRLCEVQVPEFDEHLNSKFLRECLGQLLSAYPHIEHDMQRRTLFECIYLLVDFGSMDVLKRWTLLPNAIQQNQTYKLCRNMNLVVFTGNYHQIIRSIHSFIPILRIAVNLRLPEIQGSFYKILCNGFASSSCKFPMSKLTDWLVPYLEDRRAEWVLQKIVANRAELVDRAYIQFDKVGCSKPQRIPKRRWRCIDSAIFERNIIELLGDFR